MLDFAMAVCRCDTITEEHFQSLEEVGFDREDAWDIAAIAAFFAMSNRLAHLTDMRPNLEFYNMGRVPRDKRKEKAEDQDWEARRGCCTIVWKHEINGTLWGHITTKHKQKKSSVWLPLL